MPATFTTLTKANALHFITRELGAMPTDLHPKNSVTGKIICLNLKFFKSPWNQIISGNSWEFLRNSLGIFGIHTV